MRLRRSLSAEDAGRTHYECCLRLCEGLNPYSRQLNVPLDEAVKAFPRSTAVQYDHSRDDAAKILAATLPGAVHAGSAWASSTACHARYIFAYSIFRVAADADLKGYLAAMSGGGAAQELSDLLMGAIEIEAHSFVILTGGTQLEMLCRATGDYHTQLSGYALQMMSSRLKSSREDGSELFEQLIRDRARHILPAAVEQCAGDSVRLASVNTYMKVLDLSI